MADRTLTPPIELQQRFRAEEEVQFAIVQCRRDVQLWASTTRPRAPDLPDTAWTRYHVTRGDQAIVLFMSRLDSAFANFYAEAAHG